MDTKNTIKTLSQSLLDEVKKIMKKEKEEKSEKGESEADEKREHCSESLKGDQHKIDANKNGKVDAHDFKLLRKKKGVAEVYTAMQSGEEIEEDVEELEENVSKIIKTADEMVKSGKANEMHGALSSAIDKHFPMYSKVTKKKVHAQALDRVKKMNEDLEEAVKEPYAVGMAAAMKSTGDKPPLKKSTIVKAHKIAKKIKEEIDPGLEDELKAQRQTKKSVEDAKKKYTKEEVEELDELSKATLGSYIKKAAPSAIQKGIEHGVKKAERDEMDRVMNRHMSFSDKDKVHDTMKTTHKDVDKPREKALRRNQGIIRATNRLTKEELESVELTQEEIERLDAIMADLDEARGRPPKEGSDAWKKRQEMGAAEQDEPRQHPIQQLERIKRDMRGGGDFKHKDGSTHHLSGGQAADLLDKYHGLKPAEKESMQRDIHANHAGLKKHL